MGDGSSSFTQLGGDSLAAIQFAREVDDLCGTHLPVSFVLDHSHSMRDVVVKVGPLGVCVIHISWAFGIGCTPCTSGHPERCIASRICPPAA